MLILKILGILIGITVIYILIQKLNKKCIEKFYIPLYSRGMSIGYLISGIFLLFGWNSFRYALQEKNDILNAQILMGIGALIAIFYVVIGYYRTNILYGTIGTGINLATLVFFIFVEGYLFIIYVIFNIILFNSAKPIYIIHR